MRIARIALLACPVVGQVFESNFHFQIELLDPQDSCSCNGVPNITQKKGDPYICSNNWLGPAVLPWRLPLLSLVNNYDRFGQLTPAKFLSEHLGRNDQGKPSWKYPNYDGFQLDINNQSINSTMLLHPGYRVDRFGSEGGRFVSAADAPFSQRSLPPDALNVCRWGDTQCEDDIKNKGEAKKYPWAYHVYEVAKELEVNGGPIAPAFEQPGGGIQFNTIRKISDLVEDGFLTRLNLSAVHLGPGTPRKCETKPVNCSCQSVK